MHRLSLMDTLDAVLRSKIHLERDLARPESDFSAEGDTKLERIEERFHDLDYDLELLFKAVGLNMREMERFAR